MSRGSSRGAPRGTPRGAPRGTPSRGGMSRGASAGRGAPVSHRPEPVAPSMMYEDDSYSYVSIFVFLTAELVEYLFVRSCQRFDRVVVFFIIAQVDVCCCVSHELLSFRMGLEVQIHNCILHCILIVYYTIFCGCPICHVIIIVNCAGQYCWLQAPWLCRPRTWLLCCL